MNKILGKIAFILLFSALFALPASADQLAYISKKQAKKARKALKKMDYVYLFCGCCDAEPAVRAKIGKVEIKYTEVEDYYEVVLTFIDETGKLRTLGVDLAYVWTNKGGKTRTIGELLDMEHDPCTRLNGVKRAQPANKTSTKSKG